MKTITVIVLCLVSFASFMIPTMLAKRKDDLRYLALYGVSVAVTIWCMAVMSILQEVL